MKLTILAVITVASTVLLACKSSNSKWTDKDKENAYNNCMFGKLPELTNEQMKKKCDCYVEKVMTLSPDPFHQDKIKMEDVFKLNADCLAEAKK